MVNKDVKKLSLFGFFSITATMVMTVYEYPTFATSGLHLVFYLVLAGFFWFLPYALMAAEMATVDGWQTGGIFAWVGNTLGKKFGFAAIFYQWFQITVGFVTMIYFIEGALSYVLGWKALSSDPLVEFIGLLVIFWVLTLLQFGGTKNTEKIAKAGFVIGIVIPAIILLVLGIAYVAGGNPTYVTVSAKALVPDFSKLPTLVIFVSFILAYMGIEASATHVNEMENPKRNYPLAILIIVVVAIVLNSIGGLIIAATIPASALSLNSGVVQSFQALIGHFSPGMIWCVKIIALMIAFGVMAEISAWVVGPIKGMHEATKQGILPKSFKKLNKKGVPTKLILGQGVIVTIWAAILTFGGGGNNVSFLTAISLTVCIYLVGYLLFSIAYMVLTLKKKELNRVYKIPGGTVFKMIVAIVSFIMSILALCISFIPPSTLPASSADEYLTMLIVCFVVSVIIPFAIYAQSKKRRAEVESLNEKN
ncbi:MAG: glutamate:gamma-aminobutyrate antiporter [Clostridium sp.]